MALIVLETSSSASAAKGTTSQREGLRLIQRYREERFNTHNISTMAIYQLHNPYDRQKFEEKVKKLIEEEAIVEIKKKHPSRSLPQNAYLHVILGYFGQEFGYDIDTVKYEYFKKLCNPQIFIKKRTNKRGTEVEYLRSTADLDTAEMTLAIERFRNWASAEAHIYLPAPNEYEHLLYAQQMIEQNEEFL